MSPVLPSAFADLLSAGEKLATIYVNAFHFPGPRHCDPHFFALGNELTIFSQALVQAKICNEDADKRTRCVEYSKRDAARHLKVLAQLATPAELKCHTITSKFKNIEIS